MISHGSLLRLSVRPITPGSALNRRCHVASLMMATRRAPAAASRSMGKSRPMATGMPNVVRYPAVTSSMPIRSGSAPVRLVCDALCAASDA